MRIDGEDKRVTPIRNAGRIAAGLASRSAGIGLGTASAAAIGAIAEKPEIIGRMLLFVVLIEAMAIYGLAMFFIIYSRI